MYYIKWIKFSAYLYIERSNISWTWMWTAEPQARVGFKNATEAIEVIRRYWPSSNWPTSRGKTIEIVFIHPKNMES